MKLKTSPRSLRQPIEPQAVQIDPIRTDTDATIYNHSRPLSQTDSHVNVHVGIVQPVDAMRAFFNHVRDDQGSCKTQITIPFHNNQMISSHLPIAPHHAQ